MKYFQSNLIKKEIVTENTAEIFQDEHILGVNYELLEFSLDEELWHEAFINILTKRMSLNLALEVGISKARTTRILSKNVRNVIAIDLDSRCIDRTKDLRNVRTVIGDSQEILASMQKELANKVDLMFIDGDHRIEKVTNDIEKGLNLLSPHGLLLIHDTYPRNEKFVSDKNEYCSNSYLLSGILEAKYVNYRFVTLPIHPGLTIMQSKFTKPIWMS